MSFIMSTLKCKWCDYEMNVATGSFGYGIPKTCPNCGADATKFAVIADGWEAHNTPPRTLQECLIGLGMSVLFIGLGYWVKDVVGFFIACCGAICLGTNTANLMWLIFKKK